MGYYSRRRYSMWPQYVPVAERKKKAEKQIQALKKKGEAVQPVVIQGRTIATTFWGKSWCDNLETYSDYSNRLPRGCSYVRNGSVIDLQMKKGKILAQVMGSSLYQITIEIKPIRKEKWDALVKICSGKIDSLIELLQGKFSKGVMELLIEREYGLFPKSHEITMTCSCPDSAEMCKHIAAALYGAGASLDTNPERLFDLRHVNHLDLISSADKATFTTQEANIHALDESNLSSLFGIELDTEPVSKEVKIKASKTKKTAGKVAKPKKAKTTTTKAKKTKSKAARPKKSEKA